METNIPQSKFACTKFITLVIMVYVINYCLLKFIITPYMFSHPLHNSVAEIKLLSSALFVFSFPIGIMMSVMLLVAIIVVELTVLFNPMF